MYPHQMHNNVFLSLQQQQFTGTFLTYNSNVGKRQQYIRTFFPYNCNVNSNTNAQERFYPTAAAALHFCNNRLATKNVLSHEKSTPQHFATTANAQIFPTEAVQQQKDVAAATTLLRTE